MPHELDTNKRFVRVIDRRDDGFVDFAFAIGEPDLEVELLMNAAAFDEFCSINDVTFVMSTTDSPHWGLHDARAWTSHDSRIDASRDDQA